MEDRYTLNMQKLHYQDKIELLVNKPSMNTYLDRMLTAQIPPAPWV